MRPIDIAKRLGISTTTLRKYEEMGLVPPARRTAAGYRVYTDEHAAYFVCIREMMAGYTVKEIGSILKQVIDRDFDSAFWQVHELAGALHREKEIAARMMENLLRQHGQPVPFEGRLTIREITLRTGVPASMIRYWDTVGLLTADRDPHSRYRLFTTDHVRQVLTLYAIKHAVYQRHYRHSIEEMAKELAAFDPADRDRTQELVAQFERGLSLRSRGRMQAGAALYHLCRQVERGVFDPWEEQP